MILSACTRGGAGSAKPSLPRSRSWLFARLRGFRSSTADAPFEVVLPSGVVVRVPASFDAAALERLLEVLAQARAC